MHNTPIPYEAPPACLDKLKLNAVIAGMDTLEKSGIADKDEAHELAIRQDPYLTRAIGYLATATERHRDYHLYAYAPRTVSALAPRQLRRQARAVSRAQAEITAAYDALA